MSKANNVAPMTYGYQTDEPVISPFVFGLNAGATFLTKFEWIPNGGTDGAEQEAIDVVFNINGTSKSYRKFPVVKAFDNNNNEITDPTAKEFREAVSDLNAVITHILHAYIDSDAIKAGFNRPITSFKEFVQIGMGMLPKNYKEVPLDIFLQWQWQMDKEQDKTFLEIPKKMKYGAWLRPAQPGTWKEQRAEEITDNTRKALWYVNEKGEEHPITKNGWFMLSPFAKQQRAGGDNNQPVNTAEAKQKTQAEGAAKKSTW